MRKLIARGSKRIAPVTAADRARLADMLAHRRPPGTKNTEQAFLQEAREQSGLHAMPNFMLEETLADARAAGVNPVGKIHLPKLGGADDPRAWVSSIDDVRAVCRERNWGYEEAGVYAREEPPPGRTMLADDIVSEEIENRIAFDPSLATRDVRDLREQVIEEHCYRPGEK